MTKKIDPLKEYIRSHEGEAPCVDPEKEKLRDTVRELQTELERLRETEPPIILLIQEPPARPHLEMRDLLPGMLGVWIGLLAFILFANAQDG